MKTGLPIFCNPQYESTGISSNVEVLSCKNKNSNAFSETELIFVFAIWIRLCGFGLRACRVDSADQNDSELTFKDSHYNYSEPLVHHLRERKPITS